MLALQVAAGIVLAYAIIVNQKKLIAVSGKLVGLLATLAAFGVIIWLGTAAVRFTSASITPRVWHGLWTALTLIPVFILAFSGALGLLMLGALFLGATPQRVPSALWKALEGEPKKGSDAGCGKLIGLLVLMVLINFGLSFPVWAYTPVGRWYDAVDAYGRATGWDDGLSILFGAMLWQWVWIPLAVYFLVQRVRRGAAND